MISKVFHKLQDQTIGRFIYKPKYKARGIYEDIIRYDASVHSGDDQLIEVYPSHRVSYSFPNCFGNLVSPPSHTLMPPAYVMDLQEGRIETDNGANIAVFNRHNYLLGSVSFQYEKIGKDSWGIVELYKNKILSYSYSKKPLITDDTVFAMITGGGGLINYGHWFSDALPRIHLLKKSGLFDEVNKFLVPNIAYDYQKESLHYLGISEDQIINGAEVSHLKAKRLIVSSHPRPLFNYHPKWIYDFIYQTFTTAVLGDHANEIHSNPLNIYISREDALWRKVLNEKKVIEVLESYGFISLKLSELSIAEKVKLFSCANIVVSVGGAGMSNLLFSKPGGKVLEILPSNGVDPFYHELCNSIGLDHSFMISTDLSDSKYNSHWNDGADNMNIDINELTRSLEQIYI